MKEYLQKIIDAKTAEVEDIRSKIKSSDSADEVRALGETLDKVLNELQEAKDQLAKVEEEPKEGEGQEKDPATEEEGQRNFNPVASYEQRGGKVMKNNDVYSSMEYRTAFMQYVQTGKFEMTARADEVLVTEDIGKIIPNTIMDEFIKELKVYGQLYSKVRKLNVKGGVEFPIEELIPTVTWITETTVSETQAVPNYKSSISFGYHIVEARISQSLLSSIVSLAVLEQEIAKLLAEAFVKEFDRIIVSGSGNGQPLGILNDTRVKAENKITMNETEIADWTSFRTKLFARIPLAYRGQGEILMTAATWESKIMTLRDENNRPLYSETYDPATGELVCRFAGRSVTLVEPDILKDFDTAGEGEAFMIYFKPNDYAINSNLQLGFKRYFNDDTNKWVNKGLCIMDGKLLDVNGVYILSKSTTEAGA